MQYVPHKNAYKSDSMHTCNVRTQENRFQQICLFLVFLFFLFFALYTYHKCLECNTQFINDSIFVLHSRENYICYDEGFSSIETEPTPTTLNQKKKKQQNYFKIDCVDAGWWAANSGTKCIFSISTVYFACIFQQQQQQHQHFVLLSHRRHFLIKNLKKHKCECKAIRMHV